MLGHTSVRSYAVMSLMGAVVPNGGHGTFGQLNAWLTLNVGPHGQFVASLVGVQPNLTQRASLNACL